jgi:hypothetical protein
MQHFRPVMLNVPGPRGRLKIMLQLNDGCMSILELETQHCVIGDCLLILSQDFAVCGTVLIYKCTLQAQNRMKINCEGYLNTTDQKTSLKLSEGGNPPGVTSWSSMCESRLTAQSS